MEQIIFDLGTALLMLAVSAVGIYHLRKNQPSIDSMSIEDLQFALFCAHCMDQSGAKFIAELDRRGAPHYMTPKTI